MYRSTQGRSGRPCLHSQLHLVIPRAVFAVGEDQNSIVPGRVDWSSSHMMLGTRLTGYVYIYIYTDTRYTIIYRRISVCLHYVIQCRYKLYVYVYIYICS